MIDRHTLRTWLDTLPADTDPDHTTLTGHHR